MAIWSKSCRGPNLHAANGSRGGYPQGHSKPHNLCADVLLPEHLWSESLLDYAVTRAVRNGTYRNKGVLTGLSIGSGKIQARLYDKVLEIATKSHKVWMFDVWGLGGVPEGYKVIRVEFQLRREAIKELGVDTWSDFQEKADAVWAYCTKEWLKFCDEPTREHKYRSPLPWWAAVQENFMGAQDPCPAVRAEASRVAADQLIAQLVGLASSLEALRWQGSGGKVPNYLEPRAAFARAVRMAEKLGLDGFEFAKKVEEKLSKYPRAQSDEAEKESGGHE